MSLRKLLVDTLYHTTKHGYIIGTTNVSYITMEHDVKIFIDSISISDSKNKYTVFYIYENDRYIFDSIECGVGIFNINRDFYINDANKALEETDYLVWLSREYLRSIIQ